MGLGQRLGFYGREVRGAVNRMRPVWIHGASVGEAFSAGHLVEEIRKRFPGRKIVVSAFTYTGYETARRVISDAAVIFLPLDHPWSVKRALSAVDPSVVVFLETEIWPNMLRLAHRRGTPTLLLSGRFSARSFKKYSSLSWFFRVVLRNFASMGMQSEEDASRAKRLGADPERVFVTGNLKLVGSGNSFAHDPVISESVHLKRTLRRGLLAGSWEFTPGRRRNPPGCFSIFKATFPRFSDGFSTATSAALS